MANVVIHPTSEVSPEAQIGEGTQIWHHVQIREGARVGSNCIIGKGVYIDHDVSIGSNVKVENGALIFHGARLEDGVFIGPNACLTNDKYPRAITPGDSLKRTDDWEAGSILVKYGASVGAGAMVLPDVTIGVFAVVGAGAVVTTDVPDYGIVYGNPAHLKGFACKCGRRLRRAEEVQPERSQSGSSETVEMFCTTCKESYRIPRTHLELIK